MTVVAECMVCGTRLHINTLGARRRCLCPYHPLTTERIRLPTTGQKPTVQLVRAWHEPEERQA